jgi:phenylalanyl-tRNA synthetase alpha chain
MRQELEKIHNDALTSIAQAKDARELEELKVLYLGRKSRFTQLSRQMGSLSSEEKPIIGQLINRIKNDIQKALDDKAATSVEGEKGPDLSFPGQVPVLGTKHPLTIIIEEVCGIFKNLGFQVAEGAEIEDEWFNFDSLNVPAGHTSRDETDTFYLDLPARERFRRLLRCHTSPQQAHMMCEHRPPLAVISPGRVYRPDAVDASHLFMFHQIEGFAVQEDITFAHLKGVLLHFAKEMFGTDVTLRFRPSFFPFTEPSAEVDISCIICKGKGCPVCKRSGWLEILGCGMIHPNVLANCCVDTDVYRGFAFGMGVERIAMLRYRIDDIRQFVQNDVRFLEQFYEV